MIRILLFDDNHKIRESLEFLFENTDGFEVVGSFSHCQDVEKLVKDVEPSVILMDIDMPEISGIEAVKIIRKTDQEIPIMMLTVFDDDQKIVDALAAGANGYLLKNKSLDRLVDSVRELKDGGAPLTPSIAKKVLEMFKDQATQPKKEEPETFDLSEREKEVLISLAKGASYKMIADQLNVSYGTVHSHLKRIYKKMHVNRMSEAVIKAMKNNLGSLL